jgi:hypothetical protein
MDLSFFPSPLIHSFTVSILSISLFNIKMLYSLSFSNILLFLWNLLQLYNFLLNCYITKYRSTMIYAEICPSVQTTNRLPQWHSGHKTRIRQVLLCTFVDVWK